MHNYRNTSCLHHSLFNFAPEHRLALQNDSADKFFAWRPTPITGSRVPIHRLTAIVGVSYHCGFDVASHLKGGECFGHKEESTGKEKGSGQEKGPGQEKGACKKESPSQEKSCHEKAVVFSVGWSWRRMGYPSIRRFLFHGLFLSRTETGNVE